MKVSILCLFITLLMVGCKKGFDEYYDKDNPKGGFLYNKIKDNPNFSLFAQGLERADLVQYINKGGLYTVFAPTNDAFSRFLEQNRYGTINEVPLDQLFSILSFHIVNNMWYYYDFKTRYTGPLKQTLYLTRSRKFVNVDVTAENSLKVNGVPVLKELRDIDAENGVIHGIDQVLVPLPNLEQLLQVDPGLVKSTFYKLMQVTADRAFDRFNSYDRDRDGLMDSVFYKTYPLLSNVYTSIEFRQNTAPESQGGDPVFTTILMPSDDSLNALLAPALARVDNSVPDKIAALSPSYVEAVLESYFLYDTASAIPSSVLISRPTVLRSVNGMTLPTLAESQFARKDIPASNGMVHVINATFPPSERLRSALGQASIDPELSSFMEALQQAGLMGSLASITRAGTYLAPTNAAFAAAGLDIKNRRLNGVSLTATEFSNIIRHHVINENLAPSGLTGSKNSDLGASQVLTFSGGGTTVTSSGGVVANILRPEISKGPGNIGYVYKINKLLIPKP